MRESLLVVGAGYTGHRLARACASDYRNIYIYSRSRKDGLQGACRFHWLQGDLESPSEIRLPPVSDVVFCAAPDARTEEAYRRLYVGGLKKILSSLPKAPPLPRILYTSSTSVWGDCGGSRVDEATPPRPGGPLGEILLESERALRSGPFPALVCRLAGIYGPGRNRIEACRSDRWQPSGPNRYLNFIHIDDAVGIIRLLLEKGAPGEVYLGCDGRPVTGFDLYSFLCGRLGIKMPAEPQSPPGGKRCSGEKIKNLGYSLQVPDVLTGYERLLKEGG